MIDEAKLEGALEYLATSAKLYAEARANRIYREELRKSIKAQLMSEAPAGSIADRENYAYTHAKYAEGLEMLKAAVYEEEILRAHRLRAEIVVDVWRSQNATRRAANV